MAIHLMVPDLLRVVDDAGSGEFVVLPVSVTLHQPGNPALSRHGLDPSTDPANRHSPLTLFQYEGHQSCHR